MSLSNAPAELKRRFERCLLPFATPSRLDLEVNVENMGEGSAGVDLYVQVVQDSTFNTSPGDINDCPYNPGVTLILDASPTWSQGIPGIWQGFRNNLPRLMCEVSASVCAGRRGVSCLDR